MNKNNTKNYNFKYKYINLLLLTYDFTQSLINSIIKFLTNKSRILYNIFLNLINKIYYNFNNYYTYI